MKKILIIIIIFCFYTNVRAETFYGEYFKVENIEGLDSDLIKVDSYKLYNTYNLEYIDMGYLEENDLYIKDESNYIYSENTIENVTDYDEMINVNTYTVNKRNIYFSELSNNLKIYEIEVLKNGEYVDDFRIFYNKNYTVLDINNLIDGNYDTYFLNTTNSKDFYIAIGFERTINLNDIEIIIYTKKDDDMQFTLLLERYKIINLNNNVDRKHIVSFTETRDRDDVEYFYKNKYKLYKYYKEEKTPSNNFVKLGDNLLLDDYKEVNELYMRNKLVLKDELIIKDKNTNVYDFIEYSSNDPVIDCNIDITVNGTYKCNFLLEGLSVEKDIEVNIKEEYDETFKEDQKEKFETKKEELNDNDKETINIEENKEQDINNKDDEEIKLVEDNKILKDIDNKVVEEIQVEEVSKDNENIILKSEELKKQNDSKVINIEEKKENNIINKKNSITTKKVNQKKCVSTTKKVETSKVKDNKNIIKIIIVCVLIMFNIFSIIKKKGK